MLRHYSSFLHCYPQKSKRIRLSACEEGRKNLGSTYMIRIRGNTWWHITKLVDTYSLFAVSNNSVSYAV